MRFLKSLGIFVFFMYYYLVIGLTTILNAVVWLWKAITRKDAEKHRVSPYEATHNLVFAHIQQVISEGGYLLDSHIFQTADGAQVSLWRVRKEGQQLTKPYPILMMHGLLDCAASWFLHVDKSKSLPYMLASQGYDVWVGNNRGNRLSRDESDSCPVYWNYSFDHLVEYDQPAIINGVLQETGKQKIIYVGHSQGSTQFLFGLGIHTHFQSKIAAFIGLGTVVSLENTKSHLVLILLAKLYLLELLKLLGFQKILVIPKYMSRAVGVLLYNSNIHCKIMLGFIRLLCGFSNKNKVSDELFGVIITHEPGGSSANNALHWVQCYRQGGIMSKFNHGKQKNMALYGSHHPPAYCLRHLKQLPFNTYLFRGMKDAVMNTTDFQQLIQRFDEQKIQTYQLHDYNHLDYVWSESAHSDLYGQMIEIIDNNSK